MRAVSTRLDPMLWPSAARKVETIPPPMKVVGAIDEIVDHAELVRALGAAEDDGERRGGIVEQPIADLDLGPDERSRVVRQEGGDVEHRGLLAVDDAESVGDEVIGQLG